MQETKPITPGKFAEVDLSAISVSWNPRKTFDVESLKELANSIRSEGVLEPIRVRPAGDGFDLVFGERRVRAARLAGLATIPAMVKEMTDQEAIEAKAVENDQRQDVHPLEQSECYHRLANPPKGADFRALTIAEIASRVGRSPAFVSQRLRLHDLVEAGRKLFLQEDIDLGSAIQIARLPTAQQQELLKGLAGWQRNGDAIRDRIEHDYLLQLGKAPFDVKDADLVPAAGECSGCPKRTGNQKELFADVAKEDTCTDRACWKDKESASWAQLAAKHEAGGGKVLGATEARKLFNYDGSMVYGSDHVLATDRSAEDKKNRTYKQLLGAELSGVAILAANGSGKGVLVIPKKMLGKALKEAGYKFDAPKSSKGGASSTSEQRNEAARRRAHAIGSALVGAIADAAADLKLSALVDALLPMVIDNSASETIVQRRGWQQKGKRAFQALSARIKNLSAIDRVGLFAECVIDCELPGHWETTVSPKLITAAKAFGVNVVKVQKQATDALAAAKKPQKKSK